MSGRWTCRKICEDRRHSVRKTSIILTTLASPLALAGAGNAQRLSGGGPLAGGLGGLGS
jgi:hypothetical protein